MLALLAAVGRGVLTVAGWVLGAAVLSGLVFLFGL